MATIKPPRWDEVEQDERFKALTPDQKLQTLDNWSKSYREYGVKSGAFASPSESNDFINTVNTKKQEYESLIPKEVGTLEGIYNAAANAWDSAQQSLKVLGGVDPDEAEEISKIEYRKQARSLAPGYRDYLDAEGWDAVKAFATNPIEVTTNIVAEGLAGSVPSLAAGLATGAVGAAALAPTGLGAPIGFLGGQVGGTFAGSFASEYGSKVLSELQEAGMDIKNPDSIVQFFSNEELVNAARDKAVTRGIPVAVFDALSAGIGGRVASIAKAATKTTGATLASAQRANVIKGVVEPLTRTPTRIAATEVGIQAGAGGAGEIAGSLAAGEPIEGKSVFAEIVGEVGPGAVEIATGRVASRYSLAKSEEKANKDKQVTETIKVEQKLEAAGAPLTAQALRNKTVQDSKELTDEERLRELTLQGEQLPVKDGAPNVPRTAAPAPAEQPKFAVPAIYQPDALTQLSDEELNETGKKLGRVLETVRANRPELVATAQQALDNARNEWVRRNRGAREAAKPGVTLAPAGVAEVPEPTAGTAAKPPATEFSSLTDADIVARLESINERARGMAPGDPNFTALIEESRAISPEVNKRFAAVDRKKFSLRDWIQEAALGQGDNSLQQYVKSEKLEAPTVLSFLKRSGVVPAEAQTLADVQNPGSVVQWLNQNSITNTRRPDAKQVPLGVYIRDREAAGQIVPFGTVAPTPAAPSTAPTPTLELAGAVTPAAPVVAETPAPTGLQSLTDEELNQEETIQQQRSETAADEVQLSEANQALQEISLERQRRAQAGTVTEGAAPAPAPAPAATEDPAFQRALARRELIRAEQENRRRIFERIRPKLGQASMGADPDLALAAVELAVSYAKEGVIRFTDWSARMRRDFPELWNELKDYLQDAWNTARSQVPELEPTETAAELPLTAAPTGERPVVEVTPAAARTRPTAVTPTITEQALPLAAAPAGDRPQVQITPAQRSEGVMPGGLVEYRQNLVKEAQAVGVRTVRRSFEEIESDMKGKGWNGRKSLKQFVRDVMDQANRELQQGAAVIEQVIPNSKEEAGVYETTRRDQTVPTLATIISKLAKTTGVTKRDIKEGRRKIAPGSEIQGYMTNLQSIQRNAETQLASDLGITNPQNVKFTVDFDGQLRIPNRVTTSISEPGTLVGADTTALTLESVDPNGSPAEVEQVISRNRTNVRAFISTLDDGTYEIQDSAGITVGFLTIARPVETVQTPAQVTAAKTQPQIKKLIEQKTEILSQIRTLRSRIETGNAGQPLQESSFRKELESKLESLVEKSNKVETRLSGLIDKTRQQILDFANTATEATPNLELLVSPPNVDGSISEIATFREVNGDAQTLFDAVELLSGNVETVLNDVFVNDSEITARQLDQGRVLVVPTELRDRVAPGITFDPETGIVTSAVSAINDGTRVTAAGQLTAAANEAKTTMDTDYRPVPEERVNVSDIVNGINRNPDTGEVVSTEKPLTPEQIADLERADVALSRMTTGANIDEDRATQIARVIYARALRKGITTTPRRAFSQAIQKLLERQNLRPQVLSSDLPSQGNAFAGNSLSIETILEEFEGARRLDEAGYADEPSAARVDEREMLDMEALIYRQTTLRHARLIAADPEINSGAETFLKSHARDMLTLRRRLSKEGKLVGFTQDEIANFTMNVLRDIDKNPLSNRGLEDNRSFYSADPDSIEPSDAVVTTEDKARALRIIRDVVNKYFPGIREVIISDSKGRMHIDAVLDRSLFTNPERIAEVIRGMDDADAEGFVRALTLHEYYHLGLLRKVGLSGLETIGNDLTDAQLDEAADMYFSQATFLNEEERAAAYEKFKSDRVSAAIEYITMLAERMQNGQSVQEMAELTGLPQGTLKRILAAIKTVWRRFETHVRMAFNPALREKLNNLQDGVRELDELVYGESVYPERDVEFKEAPAEYSEQVGRIFESYKSDSKGRQVFRVSIPGNPVISTTAKDANVALGNAVSRLIQDKKKIVLKGETITNIGLARSILNTMGEAKNFARPEVPKNEVAVAKSVTEKGEAKPTQGTFEFYSYSPDTRIRLGKLGPEKGGVWDNIKSIFTGRYSETRKKVGGLGSSGKWTPEQRDIQIRKAAIINTAVSRAEFLVRKYNSVIKKAYKGKEIPTDLINTALGSTENKYTDQQQKELNEAPNEVTRASLVRSFMRDNIANAEARIQAAQSQLPQELVSVIKDMRSTMQGLSDRLVEGGYLSDDLKMVVGANREIYLHRSYSIFDNPEWKGLMENPVPGSEHERIVNAADRLFRLKAQADIARDLRNESAKEGIELSVEDSLKQAAGYKDDIAAAAHNMMIDYLAIADDRESKYLLTGKLPGQRKQDIIKERGQIPKEIRELWGEIQDNQTNFVKSVAKMAAFMATTDTAKELLDVGVNQGYIWKAGMSEGNNPPAGYRPIYPPGTISDYNPLKDAYAPKEVREAFRSLQEVTDSRGWAAWMSGLTAWAMASKTVGNFPQGYVRNFLSNPLLAINGGFISTSDLLSPGEMIRNFGKGWKTLKYTVGAGLVEDIQDKRQEYISNGVIGDNVESGLFREMIQSSMGDAGLPSMWKDTLTQRGLKGMARKTTGALKRSFEYMADLYQGIDDFWKVFTYEQEKNHQRKTHPDWSEAQIQSEAARRVRDRMPTYSLSPEITKGIRNVPIIAPFITWTSEVIRTGANTLAIASEDIRVGRETGNKEMVKNGRRAIAGTLVSASLIPAAVAASKAMFGVDEEDDEALRQFVPDYEKNDQLFYFGGREGGKASYINLSYLDPQNIRAETFIAAYRAMQGDGNVGDAFIEGATQMLQPILSEQLFAAAVFDLARNRTANGGRIWNEQDTAANITKAKLNHLAKALAPGTVTGVGTRVYRALTDQVTPQGRSYSLANELGGAFLGQRVAEVDAQTDLGNKVRGFLANRSEASQLLTSVLNNRGTVDIEDIPVAYRNASRAYESLYEDMRKAYLAAIKLGVPTAQANRILDGIGESRGLSAKDRRAIITGKFPRLILSPATLGMTIPSAPTREEGIARRRAYLQAVQEYNSRNE